jgi:hypothetical protein
MFQGLICCCLSAFASAVERTCLDVQARARFSPALPDGCPREVLFPMAGKACAGQVLGTGRAGLLRGLVRLEVEAGAALAGLVGEADKAREFIALWQAYGRRAGVAQARRS